MRSDVAAAFTDGYSNAVGTGMGGVLSGHLNCFPGKRAKDLADHLDTIGLKVAIEELCGYKVVLTSVGCNTNIPGSKVQNFHIDREPEQPFIIINISLVDTDVTNGATEVAPGTSKIRLFYWEFLLSSHRRNRVRLTSRAG